MTQDDLAAAADVSTDLIRKLEQSQRHTSSIGSLHRIAAALDVDLGELLGQESMPDAAPDAGVVAASILTHLREPGAAFMAVRRAMDLAAISDDALLATAVKGSVSWRW